MPLFCIKFNLSSSGNMILYILHKNPSRYWKLQWKRHLWTKILAILSTRQNLLSPAPLKVFVMRSFPHA